MQCHAGPRREEPCVKAFWFAACLVVGVIACGSDADGGDGGGAGQTPADECADAPSFDEVTAFAQVCTNCHDSSLTGDARHFAPLGYDFDTYATTSSHAEEIRDAVEQGYMPPTGYSLSETQKAQVLLWVECGAPE